MTRILILDDDRAVLNTLQVQFAQTRRFDVTVLDDSTKALATIAAGRFDLLLLDMDMPKVTGMDVLRHVRRHHPSLEVVVITGVDDVELAVEAMKLGAYDYLCKPVDAERLFTCLDRALERSQMRGELQQLREKVGEQTSRFKQAFQGFVTEDADLKRTLGEVERIALSSNNVLICGESGTGKELVARAVHQISPRASKPFIAVNAAAFAPTLVDAQFFGHEKGAFTGAETARAGVFEEADGGTLFLDEIGEMEPSVQSKLLRVLQSGEYFRVGSNKQRHADVRVVAATNKNLDEEIEAGRFRRDLYYRLSTSTIYVPPLRERQGDIEVLSGFFLDRWCKANGKQIHSISEEAMEALEAYDYPGNLRELENVIASAAVLETSETLTLQSLPAHLRKPPQEPVVPYEVRKTLGQLEAEHIRAVIEHTHGNRSAAARILGISRIGLLGKLKRLGIDVEPEGRGGAPKPEKA